MRATSSRWLAFARPSSPEGLGINRTSFRGARTFCSLVTSFKSETAGRCGATSSSGWRRRDCPRRLVVRLPPAKILINVSSTCLCNGVIAYSKHHILTCLLSQTLLFITHLIGTLMMFTGPATTRLKVLMVGVSHQPTNSCFDGIRSNIDITVLHHLSHTTPTI